MLLGPPPSPSTLAVFRLGSGGGRESLSMCFLGSTPNPHFVYLFLVWPRENEQLGMGGYGKG